MANIDFTMVGAGKIGGIQPGWSVDEDATPVALGDSSGSAGGVSLSALQGEDSEFIIDNESSFVHSRLGSIDGKVSKISTKGPTDQLQSTISITSDTVLTRLSAERTSPPVWELRDFSMVQGATVPQTIWALAVEPTTGDFFSGSYSRLARISTSGAVVWSIAAQGAGDGQFGNYIYGIAYSSFNNYVYVGDYGNNRIQYFDATTGAYVGQWGSPGSANGQFNRIFGMGVDSVTGNVYVVDAFNNRVQYFSPTGTYLGKWGTNGSGIGQFKNPAGLAVSNGKVYVGDDPAITVRTSIPPRVQIFSLTGTYQSSFDFIVDESGKLNNFYAITGISVSENPYRLAVTSSAYSIIKVYSNTTGTELAFSIPYTGIDNITPYTVRSPYNAIITPQRFYSGDDLVVKMYEINTTLSQMIQQYVDLIDPTLIIDYAASIDPIVVAPGWVDNVWNKLKELCAANYIEIAIIDNVVTVRDIATTEISLDNVVAGSASLSLESQATGRTLNIVNYNSKSRGGIVYDASRDGRVFTVRAKETIYETVQSLDSNNTPLVYPVTIDQPMVNAIDATVFPGRYHVIDSDDKTVSVSDWLNSGGNVRVTTSNTVPGAINLVISGPVDEIPGYTGPFRLARKVGDLVEPALSVTGSGIFTNPDEVNFYTGAAAAKTPTLVAKDVKNIFVDTYKKLYSGGIWAASQASGPQMVLRLRVPTTAVEGFGLAQGSRVSFKEAKYRITSASFGEATTDITAVRHTTVGEFDELMAETVQVTVGEFDAFWSGNTTEDVKIKPLRPVA